MSNIIDKYSFEEIQNICSQCFSYRQFAIQLGLSENNTDSVKNLIQKYRLDISHFTGQAWNKDVINLSIFYYGSSANRDTFFRSLVLLRGYKCEKCGLSVWENQKIPLCIHHIDGNHINNTLENLQILCPNCHALTENYCGKNKKQFSQISDEDFVEALQSSKSIRQALIKLGINYISKYHYDKAHYLIDKYNISLLQNSLPTKVKEKKHIKEKRITTTVCSVCGKKLKNSRSHICQDCSHKQQRRTVWPSREELKQLIRTNSFTTIAKQYKVSDNAVRKWCDNYNLPRHKKEIKSYSDEEWKKI